MERNRTRKTTGFWPWLLSDGLAQRGQNEGVAPLLLSVDGGGTSETGGAVSPPGCLRSRRRRRPPRATRRMALTRMVGDSGECLRVVATELEVGHAKVLRAMGATIRYLSHRGLCEGSPDPRNSGHRIDGF